MRENSDSAIVAKGTGGGGNDAGMSFGTGGWAGRNTAVRRGRGLEKEALVGKGAESGVSIERLGEKSGKREEGRGTVKLRSTKVDEVKGKIMSAEVRDERLVSNGVNFVGEDVKDRESKTGAREQAFKNGRRGSIEVKELRKGVGDLEDFKWGCRKWVKELRGLEMGHGEGRRLHGSSDRRDKGRMWDRGKRADSKPTKFERKAEEHLFMQGDGGKLKNEFERAQDESVKSMNKVSEKRRRSDANEVNEAWEDARADDGKAVSRWEVVTAGA